MTYAYDKMLLDDAMASLGRMLDFIVYDYHFKIEEYWNIFINSPFADRFAHGEVKVICGMSGVELAYEVLHDEDRLIKPKFTVNKSKEYWVGWALCYFQWRTSLSFFEINKYISINDVLKMYNPYHEMDIRQFIDYMLDLYKSRKKETNLKIRRKEIGLSQSELALITNIPLRTIQQYEQGQKKINNAKAEYLVKLSKTLHCDVEYLLEID